MLAISSLGVLLSFLTGSPALDVINDLPRTSDHALSQHHLRALVATSISAVAAIAGIVLALVARKKRGTYTRRSVAVVLVITLGSAASLAWTGLAGGRVNHPEIQEPADREGGPIHPH